VKNPAPDYSSASLFFETGVVARLTCSIVASHDHSIRIFGDQGVLSLEDCWNNNSLVRLRRRYVIRRRLLESPFATSIKPVAAPGQRVRRRGAASMNFALGPAEMMQAIRDGMPSRLGGDFALHLSEVSLAISEAGAHAGAVRIRSSFAPIRPMPWSES
jgi:predicted dehydrogenase